MNIKLHIERWLFNARRRDYYDYLAALLEGVSGNITLKDVFYQDVNRYGSKTLRGRLSRYWLHLYQQSGGDLYATWSAHFPHNELVLIRSAQNLGNNAVIKTIGQIGTVLRVLQEANHVLISILWPAIAALLVVVLACLLVPWFTVPKLLHTFSTVPVEYYGTLTRRLVAFSNFIDNYAAFIVLAAVLVVVVNAWALTGFTGRVRLFLDNYLWWDIYRSIAALRFLMFLGVALGDSAESTIRLRSALIMQRTGASNWLQFHINHMLILVDRGVAGANTFDTGIMHRDLYWFFSDMANARNLQVAIELTCARLKTHILTVITSKATVLRWLILLACVAFMLGLAMWHYAVIDELRRALTFVFVN